MPRMVSRGRLTRRLCRRVVQPVVGNSKMKAFRCMAAVQYEFLVRQVADSQLSGSLWEHVRQAGAPGLAAFMLNPTSLTPPCATTNVTPCRQRDRASHVAGIMDWTGGTRRRFAGVKNNNAALQRQKAHFARARAAIQHEPFSSLQRSNAVDHNDDTRARSYKGNALHYNSCHRLLTQPGSGRNTVTSGNNEPIKGSVRQSGTTSFAGDVRPRQDEELHLLASRRKLLARNDWLALDHTRPLRIGFPAAIDKDRVGRRRKIKRSSETRTKAARPRLMTPLFEERLEPNAYHMSGALSPEHGNHIEIRVGTSAFGTQRRQSLKSNTSRNANMGAQSTALSHLSEESMLLGADGDSFDADQVEVPAYARDVHDALEGLVRPASSDSGRYEREEVDRQSSRWREYSLALDDDPELQQYRVETPDENSPPISSPSHVPEPTIGFSEIDNYAAPESESWNVGDPQQANEFEKLNDNLLVDSSGMAIPADENSPELDAEQEWRHLMGIVTQSQSFTSMKALDSTSEHIMTSESIQRVRPGDVHHRVNVNDDTTDQWRCFSALNQGHSAQAPDLPTTYAQAPPHFPEDVEGNTDDEALWREFIIGSQDSESGDELHSAWHRSRDRMKQSSEQPQSIQVSGLGTSDQATRGEATVYSPSQLTVQVANVNDFLEHDTESIEESPLDRVPRSKSPRNIHATPARRLDPGRFKMPRDSEGEATRRERHQHAPSHRYSSRRFKTH